MTHIDIVKVHTETRRRAHKLHHCYECCNEIRPGDHYVEDSGIDHDGHPFRYRTCLSCIAIRKWLSDEMGAGRVPPNGHMDDCGQWIWGELRAACEESLMEWATEHNRCTVHWWLPDTRRHTEHVHCRGNRY